MSVRLSRSRVVLAGAAMALAAISTTSGPTVSASSSTPPSAPPDSSSPTESSSSAPPAVTPSTEPEADSAAFGFSDLLGRVPVAALNSQSALVSYVDMQQVWTRLGLADATSEERIARLGELALIDNYVIPTRLFAVGGLVDEAVAEVGFSVANIEREIAFDDAPAALRIVETVVGAADIESAVRSDPNWSSDLGEVTSGDVTYFDWSGGERGGHDLQRRSPMRPLGVGGQLLVQPVDAGGALVTRTEQAELMEAVIDLAPADSVAGSEPFTSMVAALQPNTVVQAMLTRRVSPVTAVLDPTSTPEQMAEYIENAITIEPYAAMMIAEVTDGTSTNAVVQFAYGSPEQAATNAATLTTYVAEGTTSQDQAVAELIPGATVTSSGNLVQILVPGQGRLQPLVAGVLRGDLFVTS